MLETVKFEDLKYEKGNVTIVPLLKLKKGSIISKYNDHLYIPYMNRLMSVDSLEDPLNIDCTDCEARYHGRDITIKGNRMRVYFMEIVGEISIGTNPDGFEDATFSELAGRRFGYKSYENIHFL